MTSTSATEPQPAALQQPRETTWGKFGRRLRSDWVTALALGFFVILVTVSIFAPLAAPYGPTENVALPVQPPSGAHWFGTDEIGRDIFSRIVFGSRISLIVGLLAPLVALIVGAPWGIASGYFGRWVDTVSMRISDGLLAFPAIILALATVAALGPSVGNLTIAIGVVYIPRFARLVRGEVLRIKEQEYVMAALASGASDFFIMRKAILPNVVPILTVQFTLTFATAVLVEAGLSFLGLGAQPPTPSWGQMLSVARNYMHIAPMYSVVAGAAIFVTVLCMSLLGDALRDLLDPRRVSDQH